MVEVKGGGMAVEEYATRDDFLRVQSYIDLLAQSQQALLKNQAALSERQDRVDQHMERLARTVGDLGLLVEEVRRDAAQTKRLWTRLAHRYGWLEDEDLEGG